MKGNRWALYAIVLVGALALFYILSKMDHKLYAMNGSLKKYNTSLLYISTDYSVNKPEDWSSSKVLQQMKPTIGMREIAFSWDKKELLATTVAEEMASEALLPSGVKESRNDVKSDENASFSVPPVEASSAPSVSTPSSPPFFPPQSEKMQKGVMKVLFKGSIEVPYTNSSNHPNPTAVTIVSVSTSNRLFFIPYIVQHWTSHLIIVFYIPSKEWQVVKQQYLESNPSPLLTALFVVVSPSFPYYSEFPVNWLRNLGIRLVTTSHFMMLDMDMWVNHDMLSEIQRIPSSVMQNEKSLILIPTIFMRKEAIVRECSSFSSCIIKGVSKYPENKTQVIEGVMNGQYLIEKNKITTHKYVTREWLHLPASLAVVRIKCLANLAQEPYFIIKLTSHTPLYDERFRNYGFNKIQYFEHLRLRGARLYLLAQAYAVDMPHPDSFYRKKYVSKYVGRAVSRNERLYNSLQLKWIEEYKNETPIKVCLPAVKSLYSYSLVC